MELTELDTVAPEQETVDEWMGGEHEGSSETLSTLYYENEKRAYPLSSARLAFAATFTEMRRGSRRGNGENYYFACWEGTDAWHLVSSTLLWDNRQLWY